MAGVQSIINEASLFENPDEVKTQQQFREENIKEANRMAQHDLQTCFIAGKILVVELCNRLTLDQQRVVYRHFCVEVAVV